jgi:arylsulfatase A-like enzyme
MRDFTERTVAQIKEQSADQPFFLYMPLSAPHNPVAVHPDFVGASGGGADADFRIEVDWCVGQVLTALEEQGLADNTVVIFTADNGSAGPAQDKMRKASGHDSTAGREGWKATLYEGGQRVPFLVRWPAGITGKDRRDDGVITLEDFYATTADILNLPLPDEACDSASFLPQLRDQGQDLSARDVVVSSLFAGYNIRHGRWKMVSLPEKVLASHIAKSGKLRGKQADAEADPSKPWHTRVVLFDLHSDPMETTNVAKEHPALVAKLARFALSAIDNGRTNRGPARPGSLNDSEASNRPLFEELSNLVD